MSYFWRLRKKDVDALNTSHQKFVSRPLRVSNVEIKFPWRTLHAECERRQNFPGPRRAPTVHYIKVFRARNTRPVCISSAVAMRADIPVPNFIAGNSSRSPPEVFTHTVPISHAYQTGLSSPIRNIDPMDIKTQTQHPTSNDEPTHKRSKLQEKPQ